MPVPKCAADQLTAIAKLEALEEIQPGALSACTVTRGDRHVIVYSPLASPGRRQSDIAHEVAHLLLGHAVKEIQQVGGLCFFTCHPDEEQEANWLVGCLLLPRQLLCQAQQVATQLVLSRDAETRRHALEMQLELAGRTGRWKEVAELGRRLLEDDTLECDPVPVGRGRR
jgi:hypothetical protein